MITPDITSAIISAGIGAPVKPVRPSHTNGNKSRAMKQPKAVVFFSGTDWY